VTFSERDDASFGEMTQRDPEFGMIHRADEVAAASGVPIE